jgi:hypothetical protein
MVNPAWSSGRGFGRARAERHTAAFIFTLLGFAAGFAMRPFRIGVR